MIKSIIKLFNNGIISHHKQEIVLKKVLRGLSESNLKKSPPEIAAVIHRIVRKASGNNDPYKEIKKKYNDICLNIYDKLENMVKKSKKPLFEAMKLAIIGNIIDFGPNHSFDIIKTVMNLDKIKLSIDKSNYMFNDIKKSDIILYLADNAGEIVFDKLFLEKINHPNVFFAVRGKSVLNDVTKDDAYYIGLDKITTIIDTGQDIPGIDLETAPKTFMDIYKKADLIISKGQGNFESLSHIKNKNIYFLLMAKCELVANELGVNKGDIIVTN